MSAIWNKIPLTAKVAGGIVLTVIVITLVSVLANNAGGDSVGATGGKSHTKQLVQQAMRMKETALQDGNPVTAFTHTNFAIAYLNAARLVSSDQEIEGETSVHVQEMLAKLDKQQAEIIQQLHGQCSAEVFGDSPDLRYTGWTKS